jgi:hypothetical protein
VQGAFRGNIVRRRERVTHTRHPGKGVGLNRGRGAAAGRRSDFILSGAIGPLIAFILGGCAHSPLAWDYYDQCAQQNPSFLAMAECGKQKRLAACTPNDSCSPEGTMFMEYVDSLVLSVKTKKMTEAEALRRYTEYKSGGMK